MKFSTSRKAPPIPVPAAPPTVAEGQQFINEVQLAEYFGVAPCTLLRWRKAGTAPPHIRPNERSVLYRISELERWIADRLIHPRLEAAE